MSENILLEVSELKKYFPIVSGFFNKVVGQVRAVDGVSFSLFEGECLGLVGESGSGKTTVGRTLLRAYKPTDGEIRFHHDGEEVDIARASEDQLKTLRRHMQMIFQDPYASLNPRMTVFDIIGEPLMIHGVKNRTERETRVRELMQQVGLNPQHLLRYPHAFSGGQRQRIGVARALSLNPRLIVADEPVSALDVSVQAQILNLLQKLRRDLGLTYLFIAHDLSVVRHIADRVAVMYVGKIVEMAPVDRLYAQPAHPYTEALLAAAPPPDPARREAPLLLPGEVADPSAPPPGCPFHPRCRHAQETCRSEVPALREIAPGHQVSCHLADELNLQGMQ
ncbi:MAG: ATP-binding cassette domain-containing protein [Gemmatimonadetes bacterium]|jgi:oligopeptide/dipeptide ABC transporter ATP-binding protein|nr:ATP-binding cassette domain-containing protein [Gemmatimonadota bacterium]MBT5450955.1 ATP-binding cassette domain-containing protein [Gemmatimonadota bacterium]MBT5801495.1 ATP-binding cassette domain-containing protein [Gemmatimonadota bacterium]MBT6618451.1 ATP-binding cassette domain-containing protein [Gemmatimonadota bacterium]MBT6902846.1 ATP-binding cassette domain-containing protein [Gemmatimonadota bacterium]